jgi:peptidoglycan/xylan/chitin deacetylase (PgdA/CDA1 family)
VPPTRRMSDAHLRELAGAGFTIGGHSRSHANLTLLAKPELQREIGGCKDDLEQRLGLAVDFFAYPGGKFNGAVVDATKAAGYAAACSVIGGGANGKESLFWLYRDTFSASMNTIRDRVFLNPYARKLLGIRAQKKLRAILRP